MSTLNLKKSDVLELYYLIVNSIPSYMESHPSASISTKFSFAVNYNKELLEPIFKAIVEASKTKIPEYATFEKEKKEILEYNSEKNKQGQPLRSAAGYLIKKECIELVAGCINRLKENYKKTLDERKIEEKEIEEMLNEEIQINMCQTSFNNFPDWLDPWQTKTLRPLATETDEEILKIIAK